MSKAEQTRTTILKQAFELIYENGFQATSIDQIISKVQVTKGAFFYHFKNKEEMGITLIKELLNTGMQRLFDQYLRSAKNPVKGIYEMVEFLLMQSPTLNVKYGCPAINLIEEMSPLNTAFHRELTIILVEWQSLIISILENEKLSGKIRADVKSENAAYFITAGYAGVRNMGKIFGVKCYTMHLEELKTYLNNLT